MSSQRSTSGTPIAASITLERLLARMDKFVFSHVPHNFPADGANHGMSLSNTY